MRALIHPSLALSLTWFALVNGVQLAPGDTYTHELNVCFMSVGRFNFQVTCGPHKPRRQSQSVAAADDGQDRDALDVCQSVCAVEAYS
jgi:hypothetical protein